MKNKFIPIVIGVCLTLLFTSCAKPDMKQMMRPFGNIPIALAKRIEFSNLTITSEMKESGRMKMVTKQQDMEDILKYIRTINCSVSSKKIKNADFTISLIDNLENEKSYIYSIGVSKNQIYIYKYSGGNSSEFVYEYYDSKVIEELKKEYKQMNYSEELLMKK